MGFSSGSNRLHANGATGARRWDDPDMNRDDLDHNADSPALALWGDQLASYLHGQEGIEALRSRTQPNLPWPEADNPMVGYLIARALELAEDDGLESAITWAVAHAWFESALDSRAAVIRELGA